MGLVKRAADLAFTFRFIRMLTLDWKDWDAYKTGLIDGEGKRIKNKKIESDEEKDSYTPFIRLAANVKRLLSKVPGGGSKLGSFAAALYLIKEKYNLDDKHIDQIIQKLDIDPLDLLSEGSKWFVLDTGQLSPGIYRLQEAKLLNRNCEEIVNVKDKIKVSDNCFPIGNIFGIDVYEAKHINTNQTIYISVSELIK